VGGGGAVVKIEMRTERGLNDREHFMARARRVRLERELVAWSLRGCKKPEPPCVVTLTRFAPSEGLDDDNLSGALKACRDAVADWLGVDDKRSDVVKYAYAQQRGKWAVGIEWS
jgi:hypothetical protein